MKPWGIFPARVADFNPFFRQEDGNEEALEWTSRATHEAKAGTKGLGVTPAPCTNSFGVAGKEIRGNLTVWPPAEPPAGLTSQHISSPGNLKLLSYPSFVSLRSSEHCHGDAAGSSNSLNHCPSPGWTHRQ